jgi:hypothetical protein
MEKQQHATSYPVFNFHHVMKVISYQQGLTCQIVLPGTMSFAIGHQEPATIAWNFVTAAYYKGTGIPWKLADLDESTCLVGISFYEEMDDSGSAMRASMAHVYVRSAESQIIRGKPFRWERKDPNREPTLEQGQAQELLSDVLDLFYRQKKERPTRVVVHKSSPFTEQEVLGFDQAATGVDLLDYVHLQIHDSLRFSHEGSDYPPVRGTLIAGEGSPVVLYSVGFVPSLGTYQGGSAPSPLVLEIARNDSGPTQVCKDIMSLTKMDWNSTDFCQRQPVTTSVSRKVGHILAEMRARRTDPPQPYRFYM